MCKRFTKELLYDLCKKYNINLMREYTEKELNFRTIIEFNCTICNSNTSKQFSNIEKYNSFCKECSYYSTKNKIKYDLNYLNKICLEKSIILTKDYSNKILNSLTKIEFLCNKCNLLTNKRFQFITLYDALCHNCSNCEKGNKARKTIKSKYGVENISQLDEIKNRKRETTFKNYGVEHPLQNNEVMNKSINTSYSSKRFKFKSGNEIKCQGYEPFALQELIKLEKEYDIITGCKNVPIIWYNDEVGKKHRHYVDIFIPSKNKCIEVKSTWTIKHKNSNIFEKQKAAKELGYKYEIWVYDNKGNKVETFK
jgi:hypothetical protein